MNQGRQEPLANAWAREHGLREMLRMLRTEYEESPEYCVGCALVDGLTRELGISAEQAAAMLTGGTQPSGMDVMLRRQGAVLSGLERAGKLSRPASEYLGHGAFQELLWNLPAAAAVRVFEAEEAAKRAGMGENAEQAVLEKLRAQRALPAPLRKSAPTSAEPDFAQMSSAEFERFKQRYFSR